MIIIIIMHHMIQTCCHEIFNNRYCHWYCHRNIWRIPACQSSGIWILYWKTWETAVFFVKALCFHVCFPVPNRYLEKVFGQSLCCTPPGHAPTCGGGWIIGSRGFWNYCFGKAFTFSSSCLSFVNNVRYLRIGIFWCTSTASPDGLLEACKS